MNGRRAASMAIARTAACPNVQRIHLSVGQDYFRFCDSRRFAENPQRLLWQTK